jgi:hypothetical protein
VPSRGMPVGITSNMPANTKPVQPFTAERHLDLQADLHFFFDLLIQGKTVLDVGAGLGKSKARIRHNRVTTYEPALACRDKVDIYVPPTQPFEVVTAFEVLEHVEDDRGFLQMLDGLATQAIFFTTPNWHVAQCQSAQHYREYTPEELENLAFEVWPDSRIWRLVYYKDAEGGYVERPRAWLSHGGLKHVLLIDKALPPDDAARVRWFLNMRWAAREWAFDWVTRR